MATIIVFQEPRGVYVHREGAAAAWNVTNRLPDARLEVDAQVLATGQNPPLSWALSKYEYGPTLVNNVERVAEFDYPSTLRVVAQPNKLAAQYLGLGEEFVFEPEMSPQGKGRRPSNSLYFDARGRLVIEVPRILIADLDTLARAAGQTRTAYIEGVLAEHVKEKLHPQEP